MRTQTVRYPDGKIFVITYVLVDLPVRFEKPIIRPEKGGWSSPMKGSCSCRRMS